MDLFTDLKNRINTALSVSPFNRMPGAPTGGEPIWDQPLVGIAAGDDALFAFYKSDIGSFYWLPPEAFALRYAGPAHGPLSVLSLAFPQSEATKAEMRVSIAEPAVRWRFSRKHWPEFMGDMADRITRYLDGMGIRSVVPELLPAWSWQTSPRYGLASNWSQRHTAYAAGLGTFGLSDGLITDRGKACRFMSLIIEADLPITPRSYDAHQAWCLYFADGSCGQCIDRCPAGAITVAGHDKALCAAYADQINGLFAGEGSGSSGCGLCQTGVPCESARPRAGRNIPPEGCGQCT